MRHAFDNWSPLTADNVSNLLSSLPAMWAIAGGWALDLHLRTQTRQHTDIDVVVFRSEQSDVYDYISEDWLLYKAFEGRLSPWIEGEFLHSPVDDIWVCEDQHSSWMSKMKIGCIREIPLSPVLQIPSSLMRTNSDAFLP